MASLSPPTATPGRVRALPLALACLACGGRDAPSGGPADGAPAWPEISALFREAVYDRVAPEEQEASLWERMPVEEITLESSGCYGICPVYTLTLRRGGEARLQGIEHVGRLEGQFVGRIPVSEFARLCLFLERFRFREMEPEYSARWTDDNTMTLTVRYVASDSPVTVSDYGQQGPPELYVLIQAVEDLVRTIDWEPEGPR